MTDHYDLPVCCQTCAPPVRCEPLNIGHPDRIEGAGWETNTIVVCPNCHREFLINVTMTPTRNPAATPGKHTRRPDHRLIGART